MQAVLEKFARSEAMGYLLLALGTFLFLALYSFVPADVEYLLTRDFESISNASGFVGAAFAHTLLHGFGVSAMLVPLLVFFAGANATLQLGADLGRSSLLAFAIVLLSLSALCEMFLPDVFAQIPVFGFGGIVGLHLSDFLVRFFGPTGGVVILAGLSIYGLHTGAGLFQLARFKHAMLTRLPGFIQKLLATEALKEEEIMKQALKDALRSSTHLSASSTTKREKASDDSLARLVDEVNDEIQAEADEASEIDFYYRGKAHGKPDSKMFQRSSPAKNREKEFKVMAEKLRKQLLEFKVEGKVTKISEGPVVTTFEFEPVPGTKLSKITALSQDLARLLQAQALRILAPIPGKKVVGFEVPNADRRMIGFADLIEHKDLKSRSVELPVALGVDAFGKVMIEDLAKMPHLLVAGSTGSGKSVFMNSLIGGLIARHTAENLRFVMIDPKMVELAAYNDIPHMATPVVTDPANAAKAVLDSLVKEMERRFQLMSQAGARNLSGFNDLVKSKAKPKSFEGEWKNLPYIVLIIDELADMMMVLGRDAETPITRLAQKARAAGIHLVIATQRPSAEVVTGLIKANFPTRIAFRVLSALDSRTILDSNGAEQLIGKGDMLFLNAQGLKRMHGAFLSDAEVAKLAASVGKKRT
jgi:DNA segregation ATPase FtsK/SpoIIIE, S-DNA-T family